MPPTDEGLSIRELLLEVRQDVRALSAHVDDIDRNGSIGTKAELADHEQRVRGLEKARNYCAGALILISAFLIPVLVPVVTTLTAGRR